MEQPIEEQQLSIAKKAAEGTVFSILLTISFFAPVERYHTIAHSIHLSHCKKFVSFKLRAGWINHTHVSTGSFFISAICGFLYR